MNQEQRERYLELQKTVMAARDLKSKARETKDIELFRDAESRLDMAYSEMNALKKWFGDFPQPK